MLNIDMLYSWLADQGLDPEFVEDDTQILVQCPECSGPRCYVFSDTGAFICFHGDCGAVGSVVDLVKTVTGDFDEAFEITREWRTEDTVDPFAVKVYAEAKPLELVGLPAEFQRFGPPSTQPSMEAHFINYLLVRGISLELAQARGIGYCLTGRYKNRVVVPVVNDGTLYGFMARTIFVRCPTCGLRIAGTGGVECTCPHPIPKVLQPHGAHPRLAVYNLDAVRMANSHRMVVMEGWGDALRLPYEAVAILGSSPSATQVSLLAGVGRGRDVVVCLDGDDAGRAGTVKVADGLASAMAKVRVAHLPEGKDPGSLTDDALARILDKATQYIL